MFPSLAHVRVVLLAGGKGERFWPMSTPERPKQFLRLYSDRSMLRATYERVAGLVPTSNIYVITGTRYVEMTCEELPELPPENLIAEPEGRNTAPALGLAAVWLERVDPDAIMIVLPADHHIVDEAKFRSTLRAAAEAASGDRLVTLGIHPNSPETGYGYIQLGPAETVQNGFPIHKVQGFVEKPDLATAVRYVESGEYLWNSGMFVWRVRSLRREIARHVPELHAVLEALAATTGPAEFAAILPHTYGQAPKVSIDYGIMEKSEAVCVIPSYFGWDDVGSWLALDRMRARDDQGNCLAGEVIAHECRNLIVEGGRRRIAVVGLSDLIIVDTDQALLIAAKHRAQDVRHVAAEASLRGVHDARSKSLHRTQAEKALQGD